MAKSATPEPTVYLTVTQMAAELGVTARALRFYEGKGLLTPSRLGTTRVYTSRDRARMILILRGKRLGFTLKEIAEYLDLYDADPNRRSQNEKLLKLVSMRIGKLEQQRLALEEMLAELYEYKQHAERALNRSGTDAGKSAAVHSDRPDRSRK
jgi:DNA-binding transcriptional MerR regulator